MTKLLKEYYTEIYSSPSKETTDNEQPLLSTNTVINDSFIMVFKDLCLKIEREWRIGNRYLSEHENKNKIQRIKKLSNHTRSRSYSPSICNHSSPLTISSMSDNEMHGRHCSPKTQILNTNTFQLLNKNEEKQMMQQYLPQTEYDQRIGDDFIPYESTNDKLSQSIIDINDDLQYLLSMQSKINDMVERSQSNINAVEDNTLEAKYNIDEGVSILTSIRRSRWTYGLLGGVTAMAIAGPTLLIGVGLGLKAAIGGAAGIGIIGSYAGSKFARKVNEQSDEQSMVMEDGKHHEVESEDVVENDDDVNVNSRYSILTENEDIEPWDAR